MMQLDFKTIDEATKYWDETEAIIKIAENTQYAVVVPAVSELRYAGRRLIDYLFAIRDNNQTELQSESMADFKQCCVRARHDAIDATIAYIDEYTWELEKQIGSKILFENVPEILNIKIILDKFSKEIEISRENRSKRSQIYSKLIEESGATRSEFRNLIDLYRKTKSSEQLLIAHKNKQEKLEIVYRLALAIGISGISLWVILVIFIISR